nr:MAG TPA: hypothetical protein [Caudoviricetes sp.]
MCLRMIQRTYRASPTSQFCGEPTGPVLKLSVVMMLDDDLIRNSMSKT